MPVPSFFSELGLHRKFRELFETNRCQNDSVLFRHMVHLVLIVISLQAILASAFFSQPLHALLSGLYRQTFPHLESPE
jgi:hypothetical protein